MLFHFCTYFFFFFKQKTAYEMRISDWSSDVCSSDLNGALFFWFFIHPRGTRRVACAGSGGSPCPGGREPLFPPQDIPRLRGGRLCPESGAPHPWRAFRGPRPQGHGTRYRCNTRFVLSPLGR